MLSMACIVYFDEFFEVKPVLKLFHELRWIAHARSVIVYYFLLHPILLLSLGM